MLVKSATMGCALLAMDRPCAVRVGASLECTYVMTHGCIAVGSPVVSRWFVSRWRG